MDGIMVMHNMNESSCESWDGSVYVYQPRVVGMGGAACGPPGPRGWMGIEIVRDCGCFFAWLSSLTRCLRKSSSLNLNEDTNEINASVVGGNEVGGGRIRHWNIASVRRLSSRWRRLPTMIAIPTRKRKATPVRSLVVHIILNMEIKIPS